jgi:pimeloyl-ACP methyl ester carboxylesterase
MDADRPYVPLRPARSQHLPLRGLRYHAHTWGDPALVDARTPPLVLMHGWMDVGASFQFVVDELARREGERRFVIAADWRGFGGSTTGGADCFWFPDYLADLDALLDALAPDARVDLVGHSMGGNVVMSYAGVRPGRIRRLVNLEGFGMPATTPEQAPERLARWLDELKAPMRLKSYDSPDEVAERLRRNNPRLAPDRARWLAPHWAERRDDGRWHVLGDPAHKRVNPVLYRAEEILATWRRIEAPVLWVEGEETDVGRFWGNRYPRAEFEARLAQVPRIERVVLKACGHMVHHDQPGELADALLGFLTDA